MIPYKQILQEIEDVNDFEDTWVKVEEKSHQELLKIKEELEKQRSENKNN
jgi:hypothetical protein